MFKLTIEEYFESDKPMIEAQLTSLESSKYVYCFGHLIVYLRSFLSDKVNLPG